MNRWARWGLPCAAALLVFSCGGSDDPPPAFTEMQRLQAGSLGIGACFGWSVDVDGARALVGACDDSSAAYEAGAVYVYERVGDQWTERQRIHAYNAEEGDHFGSSVAVDGSFGVAGAPEAAGGWGATYPLHDGGTVWTVGTSRPMGGYADPPLRSGWAVALHGRLAMVGTPRAPSQAGHTRCGLVEFHSLGPDGEYASSSSYIWSSRILDDAELGYSVAIHGDKAAAGAPGEGAVYAYTGNADPQSWAEVQRIVPPDGPYEGYGAAVAIDGDLMVVGSPLTETVFLYGWNGSQWAEFQRIRAWDGMEKAYFGWSVAIDGVAIVVGAPYHSEPLRRCGAVYVFRPAGSGWGANVKLLPSVPRVDASFGLSVAIDGDTVVVGAAGEETDSGAVYFYDFAQFGS